MNERRLPALSAVTSVGALLPRDLLERVAGGDGALAGIAPADYGLAPGERITDAIARSWNRLRGVWESFRRAEGELPASDVTATALTRERWLRPLLDELGFAGLPLARGLAVDGKDYPISHLWGAAVPVHLPGCRVPIDRVTRGVAGAARQSPHGLVQEYLNRSDATLWGIVSNGLVLRVLRDNAALTRQAYLEVDVEAIFDGELFSDFVLLWLCAHRTRFEGEPAEKCFLEQWSTSATEAGTRARERLRDGVEAAIVSLGQGLVEHPANGALRQALHSRELTDDELLRQLLRLVYRLLFLLVAESRDLLLDPEADETTRQRYRFYSVERLRVLARRRRGTPHGDLWHSLTITMGALGGGGAPAIGLRPLGSFLWSPAAVPNLHGAALDNRHLLDAIRHLCYVRDAAAKADRAVDYHNLGAEELGSIYESLLELHATVDDVGRRFAVASAAGNERKTSGSYYTPTSLIRVLLDSALDPVLDEAAHAPDPEAAILALRVLDPAAGSGHFLIAAAHRIAGRLASARAGGVEPAPGDHRRALRDVIAHCVYGIDVNPMAVELCKVSLWMEATEPGRPLSFLDHHVVCGNSLLGATPALIDAGVPDDAFKPIEGDDKGWATTLRKSNKEARKQKHQGVLALGASLADDSAALAGELAAIDAIDDSTAGGVAAKEQRFADLQASAEAARARLVADAWCAAFVAPKTKASPAITEATVRLSRTAPERLDPGTCTLIKDLAAEYRFLHLHLTFPDVFHVPDDPADAENQLCGWSGGFDVVLGNPPWKRVKLQEREWFAAREPAIATAPNAAARKALIARLVDEHPELHAAFLADQRRAEGESTLLRNSGRFPLAGRGDVNTYAVFAELMRDALCRTGRVGVIVPTGIATDDTTKFFFSDLVDRSSLASLYGFYDRRRLFVGADVHNFCLLILTGLARPVAAAEMVFFARDVSDLDDEARRFTLSPADFALLNPNTKTCPVFRTRRDAEITKAIYRRVPVLVREHDPDGNPWNVKFSTMFHMANDARLFRTREQLEADCWTLVGNHFLRDDDRYVPLYEAKMLHHFDHRWATYDGETIRDATLAEKQDPAFVVLPRYWIPAQDLRASAGSSTWLASFRNVARATDERTFIAAAIPLCGVGHSAPLFQCQDRPFLLGTFDSVLTDWVTRQKLGGVNLTFGYVFQLPVTTSTQIPSVTNHYVLELTYTAWDLEPFAADLGYHGPPFRWDVERRALVRAELDALMFRVYGIERDDADYIMDTFSVVKRRDEAAFGEYRTKRLILERFDAMAAAERDGRPYETALDPPPADPSCAHPESTRPAWATAPTTSGRP